VICDIIRPNVGPEDSIIECEVCELSYSLEEYNILSKRHKLGYFYNEEIGIFCHECLFKIGNQLALDSGEDEYKVIVREGDKGYAMIFYKDGQS